MEGKSLYQELCDFKILHTAWLKVKEKGSKGGIDNVTIQAFEADLEKNLKELVDQLSSHRYIPEPYQEIQVAKKEKQDFRSLSLPTVKDKIVQQAVRSIIEPILEKEFLPVSYAYRENKGPTKAIRRVLHLIKNEKKEWVTLCDINKFFDTIDHNLLFHMLSKRIQDEELLILIKLWIKMGKIDKQKRWKDALFGIPQGAILSPLLANLYLHPFDQMMVSKNYGYVRYADDFVILTNSKEAAYSAYKDTKWFIEKRLLLRLNEEMAIKRVEDGFDFLGITFEGTKITLSEKKLYHLKERIEKSLNLSKDKSLVGYNNVIEGIGRYYGSILPQELIEKLDECSIECLKNHLNDSYQKGLFVNRAEIEKALSSVNFLSQKYQLHRQRILKEISLSCRKVKPKKVDAKATPIKKDPIKLKKRQYQKLLVQGSELVITTPGVFLGRTKRGIILKKAKEKICETSPVNLKNISILCGGVSISSNVVLYCAQKEIPIFFAGFDGKPYAKIYPFESSHASIVIAQVKAYENNKAHELIKNFVFGKIKNQTNLVKYFFKYKKRHDKELRDAFYQKLTLMESLAKEAKKTYIKDLDILREKLLSLEGRVASIYWELVEKILKDDIEFQGRVRKGATDLVNSLLNYGYGILYGRVWVALIKAGLNPHVSYLHKPQDGKPTLVFDLIEEFRQQAVDRPIFAMLTKGEKLQVKEGMLTDDTKKRVAEKVFERLNNIEVFRTKELNLQSIIDKQAEDIAAYLEGKISTYRPYIGKW